jgi:hypothetical protein
MEHIKRKKNDYDYSDLEQKRDGETFSSDIDTSLLVSGGDRREEILTLDLLKNSIDPNAIRSVQSIETNVSRINIPLQLRSDRSKLDR